VKHVFSFLLVEGNDKTENKLPRVHCCESHKPSYVTVRLKGIIEMWILGGFDLDSSSQKLMLSYNNYVN